MNNRPTLYMLCGVPGSGKSTWIRNRVIKDHTHIASTDSLIEIAAKAVCKTYDDVFQDTIKSATKTMYELLKYAVEDNMDIIWDQTNLDRKSRGSKLIMIPDHYYKIAVYFPTPDDLHERLIHREMTEGKSIPDYVMKSMLTNFTIPDISEGFDKVVSAKEMVNA